MPEAVRRYFEHISFTLVVEYVMDKVNRVQNIKQRFESMSTISEPNDIKNGQLKNLRIIQRDFKINKSHGREVVSNVRPNIKRKPAFRRDKILVRNDDLCVQTKSSIVSRQVHHFNNMDDIENESSMESDTKKNCEKPTNNLTPLYSKIKKPKNVKTRQPTLDSLSCPGSENSNDKKLTRTKLISENIKSVDKENNLRSLNGRLPNDVCNELSDTLKRILKCPLPSGPPPQKPPRTFASHSESLSESESKIKQPQRSKTESEIKLKKIENALAKHQKLVFSPNSTARKISSSASSTNSVEKCAGINKNKRRSSEKCILDQLSCLSDLNCSTQSRSMPYFPAPFCPSSGKSDDRHIYEDPTSLNSSVSLASREMEVGNLYYMVSRIESGMTQFVLPFRRF